MVGRNRPSCDKLRVLLSLVRYVRVNSKFPSPPEDVPMRSQELNEGFRNCVKSGIRHQSSKSTEMTQRTPSMAGKRRSTKVENVIFGSNAGETLLHLTKSLFLSGDDSPDSQVCFGVVQSGL
jgi:hypothetical protein